MKQKVTLVGEYHEDLSHLEKVSELIQEKLNTNDTVFLALEQSSDISLTIAKPKEDDKKQRSRHNPKSLKDKIQELPFTYTPEQSTAYTELLNNICSFVPEGKKVVVMGVDDDLIKSFSDTARDKAMKTNIINGLRTSKAEDVVYPVGSAHIFEKDDEKKGQRLGSLLHRSPKIELSVVNFYKKGSIGYEPVQNDIDEFKKYNIEKQNKDIEIGSKKSTKELSLKDGVLPKRREKELGKKLLQNKRKLPDELKKQASELGKSLSSQQRNVSSSSVEPHIKKKVKKEETLII